MTAASLAPADLVAPNLPTVLCLDDEPNVLSALKRLFRGKGWTTITAESGAAGLQVMAAQTVDLVISDMRMPVMDGAQFLAEVRRRWPDTMRLLLTGYSDVSAIIDAVNRGEIYRYITKPWDDNDIILMVRGALEHQALSREKMRLEALTLAQNQALKELNASLEDKVQARTRELQLANEQLKANFFTSIKVFSTLLEMRGGNLSGHARRVADLSRRIAIKMNLDNKLVQQIFVAGLLHEIGKVGFSDELLNTPVAMMTPEQLDAYRKHTAQAELLLLPLPDLRE
ncbi:MAG: response regulator, partial [Rhodoferax sp.]|nr:response regulator [Rhodoferax sp.]